MAPGRVEPEASDAARRAFAAVLTRPDGTQTFDSLVAVRRYVLRALGGGSRPWGVRRSGAQRANVSVLAKAERPVKMQLRAMVMSEAVACRWIEQVKTILTAFASLRT